MCYSYKGGSGRTVASGNIAAALAKQGKKVLIIDMDIEAPGLQNLFDVTDSEKYRKRKGLQDYLKRHLTLDELDDFSLINLADEKDVKEPLKIPNEGSLRYLIATNRSTNVLTEISNLPERMEDLINFFSEKYYLDYIVLDAASGIREAFTIALHVTDLLLIFFRWTRQHLEGTIKVGSLIDTMQDMGETPRLKDFKLIASAAPREEDLKQLDNTVLAGALAKVKQDSISRLADELDEAGELFYEIPEMIELKWRERILSLNQKNTPYEVIAKRLIEEHDS